MKGEEAERCETEQGEVQKKKEKIRSLLEAECYNKTAGCPHKMTKQEQRQNKGGRVEKVGSKKKTEEISTGNSKE